MAAAGFAGIAALVVTPRLRDASAAAALWSALGPLLFILLQAGVYWLSARVWVGRSTMPAAFAAVYRALRIINVLALAGGLIGVVLWWPDDAATALLIAFIWLFGAVEYVNYFIVRLSYPLGRWATSVVQWRQPRLIQDLNASRN